MSFGDHLEDLRKRVFYALLGPVPIFIVCLIFGGPLLALLVAPAEEQLRAAGLPAAMLATSPTEPFTAYLKVATIAALLLAGPWILFQFWLFIAPGLYRHERRFAYFLFPLSALLTVAGTLFLYKVLLPVSLRFLILFGSMLVTEAPRTLPLPEGVGLGSIPVLRADPPEFAPGDAWVNLERKELRIALPRYMSEGSPVVVMSAPLTGGGLIAQQYRIGEYVNLVFSLGIVFALAFQLPVVLLLAGWVGLVDRAWLGKYRKHALFIGGVISAMVTPADPMSMLLLLLPLYGLYEFGMLLMRFVPASRIAGKREPADAGDP